MRIPFTLRILLVLGGLACLIGPALIVRERANAAGVAGNMNLTVVRTP